MIDNSNNSGSNKPRRTKPNSHQSSASPEVSDLIADQLRSFYDDVAKQPVPDRFLDLLQQLQAATPPKEKS